MTGSKTTIHITHCPICGNKEFNPFISCKDYFTTQEAFEIMQCKKCGFVFTQDFPSEEVIGKYYDIPEYVSHSDTQKGIINALYHRARKIALKSKSKIVIKNSGKKTGMLLEIGCGTGYFLNRMKELKWIVTGIEKSESARKYAKMKFGLNCQDSEYLYEIPDKTKDVVAMWHVLEHMEHLNKVMERIHHILKDDGTAIIALPNKDSFDAVHYKKYWAAYDVPRHLWHFSPDSMKELADKHNFELIAIKPMYMDAFYISMLSEKYKKTCLASLVGLLKGEFFFLRTLFNKNGSSSLIYVLKKKISLPTT